MDTAYSVTPADLVGRIAQLAQQASHRGIDGVAIAPGADLRYFLGSSVASHERLTALVVTASGHAELILPILERGSWTGMPVEHLGIPFTTWEDGDDPYRVVAESLRAHSPQEPRVIAIDNYMPAIHALGITSAIVGSELVAAGPAIAELRMRKSVAEMRALQEVGAAIDRVHERIGEWLRPGRSEKQVAADITAALVEEGHERADFVIVAAGPHGASPHHAASDRIIEVGDPVIVDIGGPYPSGYFSDCTRTYFIGEPHAQARKVYETVLHAQRSAVAAVKPGVSAESIDAVARDIITAAGYGDAFITRTGHGIGLEVHEAPYIVRGNSLPLEPGMAFSIEPGIYLPGKFGVRIEDIVVVTADGAQLCNQCPTDITVLPVVGP